MNTLDDLQQQLDELRAVLACPMPRHTLQRETWQKMHHLAEAGYLPALAFFVACLDDPDWAIRDEALSCLGFHFDLREEGVLVEKIRRILLTDFGGDGLVRTTAAGVLGRQSYWPDPALRLVLESDPDELLRSAAYSSLLQLAGVPYIVVQREMRRIGAGAVRPSWREVTRVVTEAGLFSQRFG